MRDKLREARKNKGLTQKEMAEKLKISKAYYCLIEKGQRRVCVDLALKIAEILQKSVEELFKE